MGDEVKTCPRCGIFTRDRVYCHRDGEFLVPSDGRVERYRVVDWLGEGSMGIVYLAKHLLLDNRVVALKMLHREQARDQSLVDRFFREARAAGRVNNPHIVRVFDFGVTKQQDAFLVMEFLEGQSLRRLIDTEGPLAVERALELGAQIAEGLEAAHCEQIIHRDLKPGNIQIVPQEDPPHEMVKLLDFGVALLGDARDTRLTRAGMILGTPAYMSPEQAAAQPVDARTDIFSLGIILFEMLSQSGPFPGENAKDLLLARITQDARPLSEVCPELDGALHELVSQMLDRQPEQRPPSMREVAVRLREELEREHVREFIPTDGVIESRPSQPRRSAAQVLHSMLGVPRHVWLWIAALVGGVAVGVMATLLIVGPREVDTSTARGASTPAANGSATGSGTPSRGSSARKSRTLRRKARARRRSKRTAASRRRRRAASAKRSRERNRAQVARRTLAGKRGATPTAVATPKTVVIVASRPAGGDVFEGNNKLGQTPLKVASTRQRHLAIHLEGYRVAMLEVAKGRKGTLTRKLRKRKMSWDVMSLRRLKRMRDRGEISSFTYRRRRASLLAKRKAELEQLKVQYKMGNYTEQQYRRQVSAVKQSYE